MNSADCPYAFRVVGGVYEPRRLVDATAAFVAHCAADPKAQLERECYLSAFRYGADFREHMRKHETPKGFTGPCWSPWLWFDLDREQLGDALAAARRLVGFMQFRYHEFANDDFLYFYSGKKGLHVGVPLTHNPPPSPVFNSVCRKLAEGIAAQVGVTIDTSVYARVQPFRAPNSTHPKTGLRKRRILFDELMHLSTERVVELAREPLGFEPPVVSTDSPVLAMDWREAEAAVSEYQGARSTGEVGASGRLNRATLEFIQRGAEEGERTTRLFQASANLREFAAPLELVHALLTEVALDSGLPPSEVARVIRCGIEHADRQVIRKDGAA